MLRLSIRPRCFARRGGISLGTKPPIAPLSYGASQTDRIARMRPPRRPRGCAIAAAPAVLRYGGVGTPVWCGEKRQHLSIYNAHFTAPSRKTLGAPLLRPPIVAEAGYGQIFTLRRRVSRSDPRSVSDSSISGDCARAAARPPESHLHNLFAPYFKSTY